MRALGFDKSLALLLVEHRGSCQAKMFGWEGTPTPSRQPRSLADTGRSWTSLRRPGLGEH